MSKETKKTDVETAADKVIRQINEKYGAKTIKRPSESVAYTKEHYPSGSLLLDLGTGYAKTADTWGFPSKGIIEICGGEGAGKTTLALLACRYWLSKGEAVVYNCLETTGVDEERMVDLGLDVDNPRFHTTLPTSGVEAWNLILDQLALGFYKLIVLDSLAALSSKAEDEMKSMGDSLQMGGSAQLNNIGMRKVYGHLSRLSTMADRGEKVKIGKVALPVKIPSVIITNQVRSGMGSYEKFPTPGGQARKHLELVRIGLTNLTMKGSVDYKPVLFFSIEEKKEDGEKKTEVKAQKRPVPKTKYTTGVDEARPHIDIRDIQHNEIYFENLKNKAGVPYAKGRFAILHKGVLGHRPGEVFTEVEIFLALTRYRLIYRGAKGWYRYRDRSYRDTELIRAVSKDLDFFRQVVYDSATNELFKEENKARALRGEESLPLKEIPEDIFSEVDFKEIRRKIKEEKEDELDVLLTSLGLDIAEITKVGPDVEDDELEMDEGSRLLLEGDV